MKAEHYQPRKNHPQSGLTLTEAVIVLGIVGIVMGGIWAAVSSVSARRDVEKAVAGMAQTVQSMRTMYQKSGRFSTLAGWGPGTDITARMIPLNVISPNLIGESGGARTMVSPWGTDMQIRVGAFNAVAGQGSPSFDIVFDAATPLTNAACVSIVAQTVGPKRDPGLLNVNVGGVNYSGAALNGLDVTNIPACASATFTFSLRL